MTSVVHAIAVGSHGKCKSLVRIPSASVEWVKWALDSGAAGIVVPMVQSKTEAEQIVKYACYPPVGQRSFGPFNAPWTDLSADSDVGKYFSVTASNLAVVAMIESVDGVTNAEDIIKTPGINGIFIGPVDLRLSLGLSGADGVEPEYVEALEKLVRVSHENQVTIGIFSAGPEVLKKHIGMGFDYFLVAGDSTALVTGANAALISCKNAVADAKL
jgi:2-keto-3-deoxy-L-rhamnonate aldolase RhmA